MTDWYRSYRSIGRNRWHTPFVYRFIPILPIPSILSEDTSVLLFRLIQKWKLISCKQWICWQWNCNWKSKDQTIYYHFIKKKSSKKSYIFFKTRFKVSFWWPILARFVGAQFFHDLDLPPFQNNISSTCSYLPKSIKIVSDQVILSSNNGKQWKAI